jgi:uncharacterized protein YdeI (BOF family)
MSIHRRLLLILSVSLVLLGCESGQAPAIFGGGEPDMEAATAHQLDTLSTEAQVSVSGTVVEQDGEGIILLDDGTGLVRIELPERPPLLTGQQLLASGTLTQRDGLPLIEATEWHYDSTAVPVHSD